MKSPCGACSGWLVTDLGAPEDSSEFQGKTDASFSHSYRDLNLWKVTTRPDAKVLSGTGILEQRGQHFGHTQVSFTCAVGLCGGQFSIELVGLSLR